MNDPLKDFVEQHRAEFDHLNAPAFKLDQLRNKPQLPPEKKKTILLFSSTKWLVAASLLVAIITTWLVYSNKEADKTSLIAVQKPIEKVIATPTPHEKIAAVVAKPTLSIAHTVVSTKNVKSATQRSANVYAGLTDSTSASTRLLAILEIEKSGNINNYLLDKLASTLNHDGNTNVRLAALSLMQQYRDDAHVSNLLVRSLNTQTDPMVQLGLVGILGKMKNVKIDGKLLALANNPETFAAVRDEAYNILLSQNKL